MILDRCQSVLDELEGSHAAVNRVYPQQRNSNFQARAPPDRRQNQGQYQRSGGAAQRYRAHSPTKAPKHPDNYCFICLRDRNPNASNHFLRQCPQLPQRERDLMARVFDKTLQYRSQPRDTWPEKIEGQTVNVKLVKMVEDFYGLDPAQNEEDQQTDYLEEELGGSLAVDWFSKDSPAALDSSNVTLKSIKCKPPEGTNCSCNCDQSCKKSSSISMKSVKIKCARIDCTCGCTCKGDTTGIANRRVNVSPSPAFPVEITNDKTRVSKRDNLTCDTGCTAECIVNADLVHSLGLPLQPTNIRTATLGDGETDMSIMGEVQIDTVYMANPIKVKAVVTKEVEGILLGIPGMEKCGIDVICSKKELHFPNGTVFNYLTKTNTKAIETPRARALTASGTKIINRRIQLQTPSTSTWSNPGESITLTSKPGAAKKHWSLNPEARPFQPQTPPAEPIPREPKSGTPGQKTEAREPNPQKESGSEDQDQDRKAKESIKPETGLPTKSGQTKLTTRTKIEPHQLQALLLTKSGDPQQIPKIQGQTVKAAGLRPGDQGQRINTEPNEQPETEPGPEPASEPTPGDPRPECQGQGQSQN